jgi:hypothetical protein
MRAAVYPFGFRGTAAGIFEREIKRDACVISLMTQRVSAMPTPFADFNKKDGGN